MFAKPVENRKTIYYHYKIELIKILFLGNIVITTLPPIETAGMSKSDVEQLMRSTRESMLEVFRATSKEVQANLLQYSPTSQ